MVGEILGRLEKKGLKLVGMKMLALTDELLDEHYAHLANLPFFGEIKEFMKTTPIIAVCIEGLDAIETVRRITGITLAREAEPGTIRGDLAMSVQCNLIHASDSPSTAAQEIRRFFRDAEIFPFDRYIDEVVYALKERGQLKSRQSSA